jgi:hypothetical protein
MYLGRKIWKRLQKHTKDLKGYVSEADLLQKVESLVKPYGCKVIIKQNKLPKAAYFTFGGEYCPISTRQAITIFLILNASKTGIYFTKNRLKIFLFLLSQTIQHELIHKSQCKNNKKFYTETYHFTKGSKSNRLSTLKYFAMKEEVEAYAHDLAMEIKYYYSDIDSNIVLRNINNYDQLSTWRLYRSAFKKSRWPIVRNQLLKKTYKWLPSIKEKY